jgi:hypothetical protein
MGYTIKMLRNYCELFDHVSDPQELFDFTCATISQSRRGIDMNKSPDLERVMAEDLEDGLTNLVFSSNSIERAGFNLVESTKICVRLFRGEDVKAEEISEGTAEYDAAIDSLISTKICELGTATMEHVIQSRREVIQHTKALTYITRGIVLNNQALTEELIKSTHRILVTGIDRKDTGHGCGIFPWQKYEDSIETSQFMLEQHLSWSLNMFLGKWKS